MDPTLAQMLTLGFLFAVGLVAYEMNASLQPPYCAECSHCRERRAEQHRRQAEVRERYARQNGLWDREDDDVRRR